MNTSRAIIRGNHTQRSLSRQSIIGVYAAPHVQPRSSVSRSVYSIRQPSVSYALSTTSTSARSSQRSIHEALSKAQ
ncbi:unnamed protein product [Toxocara canis]|uniref:Uncharacterized protein n=1 Tax=Toxocara canis TaxID=6265 RepID=A0A183TVA8_TOXCA|nr:unnamed protein product [Toxocara canis]